MTTHPTPGVTRRAGNDEPNPEPHPSHDEPATTEEQAHG